MFAGELIESAERLLATCRAAGWRIATAESCTGGLLAAALTEIPGSSDVFDCGFVTYSNDAKSDLLGVPAAVVGRHGAVSAAVAVAMTEGVLQHTAVELAASVTGIAGPGGGTAQKPVGLVYIATQRRGGQATAQRFNFHEASRPQIRMASVREALRLMSEALA